MIAKEQMTLGHIDTCLMTATRVVTRLEMVMCQKQTRFMPSSMSPHGMGHGAPLVCFTTDGEALDLERRPIQSFAPYQG